MDAISTSEPIALTGVRKSFGALCAVDGVSLSVSRGEIYGVIGHNGAGKSTLFRILLGLLRADAGEVRVAGCEVGGPRWREARRLVGYLPEQLSLYDNLDARETLAFFARLKGAPAAQIGTLLEQVGLAHAADRPVRTYSKGMRQRLGLAQALLGEPQVLLLDEPGNGLDPKAIREFYALLAQLRSRGVTILITSHILAELQQRVDRLAILAGGRVLAQGSVQQLREHLELPLAISLRGSGALLARARELAEGCATAEYTPEGLALRCERRLKMELLARLSPLAAGLDDFQIHEPSLEDVYFGLSPEPGAAAPASTPSASTP